MPEVKASGVTESPPALTLGRMSTQFLMVFCTCPDRASATTIARHLVEQRLAACINLVPGVGSVYRWRGGVEEAEEVMLVIKTRESRLDEVEAAIEALHPYELPELLAIPVSGGTEPYLTWLEESTE